MTDVAEWREPRVGVAAARPQRSCHNFLDGLRALGAKVTRLHDPFRPTSLLRRQTFSVFLSCPLETWTEWFGEPQEVSSHYDLLTHVPFQAWQQPFADGVATCMGHLFERSAGRNWVVVGRVLVK